MVKKIIDINCDLGEGIGNDKLLMPYLSSCSIACGGHFGDEHTIKETIKLAKKHHVKIGAHPSYPDRESFGRQKMEIDDKTLKKSISDQINLFKKVCESENMVVNHIKLHGALYNLASQSAKISDLVIESIINTGLNCKLYTPYGSVLAEKGKAHFEICYEAFIDRRYHNDLTLVDRTDSLAIIRKPELAWHQLYEMIKHQETTTIEGQKVVVLAETFCLHGDHKGAIEIIDFVYNQLQEKQIRVKYV